MASTNVPSRSGTRQFGTVHHTSAKTMQPHVYIRSSIPSWPPGRYSDHIPRYSIDHAMYPALSTHPMASPHSVVCHLCESRTHTELDETTPRHSVTSAGLSKHRSRCLVLQPFSQLQTQSKWAARSLYKSRLTTVRGHHLGTRSHWVAMEVLTAGIAPNTDCQS